MMNTLILGVNILRDLRISKSKDIKNPQITKLANTPIRGSNGFDDATIVGESISMSGLDLIYLNSGDHAVATYANTKSRIVAVVPGKTYFIFSPVWHEWYMVYGFVKSLQPAIGTVAETIQMQSTSFDNVKSFTVPNDGNDRYFMINTIIGSNMSVDDSIKLCVDQYSETESYSSINGLSLIDTDLRKKVENELLRSGFLDDKIWVAIGDSITEHNFRTNKNYHDYISESCKNLIVHNYGISGSGYKDRFNVADTITQIPDILTVFWGTNDWGFANVPLGSFLDSGTETVSGRINTALSKLIAKFPKATIAIFTPLPRSDNWGSNAPNNTQGYTLEQLSKLIIQYAQHFSLPYLDLYHESNLPVWTIEGNKYYFTAPGYTEPDGLHPNDAGQMLMARKIKSFLESI